MNLAVLKAEITNDPAGLGYSGKTDEQICTLLNATTQTRTRSLVPSYEIIEATVPEDWAALTAAEKQRYQAIISAGQVLVSGTRTRAMLAAMFGATTPTRTNLLALQNEPTSRAAILGLETITPGDIERARAYTG